MGLCAEFKGQVVYFVNIYSSCLLAGKHRLWAELVDLKNKFGGGWWCVGGDFNSTREGSEIMGSSVVSRGAESNEFNEFIEMMDLVDVPSIGSRFTWSNKEGRCKSRLDRFLLSEGLIDSWSIIGQKVGDMDISDHAPIWLKANNKGWGPKPFRFNNCRFEDAEFMRFVEDSWKDINVAGNKTFIIKENLKILRTKLRIWNKEKFGWIDLKIEEATKKLNLGVRPPTGSTDDASVRQERDLDRKAVVDDLWKHLRLQESLLRQKSRIKWLKGGDL
ncbi:uncharacterized protein LOC131649274 [Vicia villosa]|uniref:uncharacterized protein LOC131649274 n=1 Tax=Vicia villosa TaxID=3911 RepID=UPI00273C7112|nr:uncharacterized protein LOC131649274 [Vicia villosa]